MTARKDSRSAVFGLAYGLSAVAAVGLTALFAATALPPADPALARERPAAEARTQSASTDDALRRRFARPLRITFPDESPYAPQIAALGKMLFFDQRVSGDQHLSCASCHNPSFGWETPNRVAVGAQNVPLLRHAPSIQNLAESPSLGRDGASTSFEAHARRPITHPLEMNADLAAVARRIYAVGSYRRWFEIMFPGEGVSERTILQALATFQRTQQSGWAPFDDWVAGDDDALTAQQRRGLDLFVGAARCADCHTGWAMTDHGFHDIGLPSDDIGRAAVAPPGEDADQLRHAFKTPSLRNIALRAPYMHDGSLEALRTVLTHYALGGVDRPSRSAALAEIDLNTSEIDDLIAFLDALTAHDVDVSAPILPAR